MGKIIKNILTFGAQGRIDKAIEEFNDVIEEHGRLQGRMLHSHKRVNRSIKKLSGAKYRAIRSLKKVRLIHDGLSVKDRDLLDKELYFDGGNTSLEMIKTGLDANITLLEQGKHLTKGFAAMTASYFLVGDVAATGAGLAARGTLLTGTLALPALAVMGALHHLSASKKIKEIKTRQKEVVEDICKMMEAIDRYEALQTRAEEVTDTLERLVPRFKQALSITFRKLYPVPVISFALRKKGDRQLTADELSGIGEMVKIVHSILGVIDRNILDEAQGDL